MPVHSRRNALRNIELETSFGAVRLLSVGVYGVSKMSGRLSGVMRDKRENRVEYKVQKGDVLVLVCANLTGEVAWTQVAVACNSKG